MRLARPILNKNGLVIIREDTELTENLIGRIRDLGVDAVQVVGPSLDLPPMEETLAALDRRFKKVETAPHMDLLKRLIAEHIKSLYEEHGPEDTQK